MISYETINEIVRIVRENLRMCDACESCSECEAASIDCNLRATNEDLVKLIQIVDAWSTAHPQETVAETNQKNDKPCVKTIHDELEGAIYRDIASNKTRIENLEYDVSVIRNNLSALGDQVYELRENVYHTSAMEPSQTPEPKRTNKDVLLKVFPDARMNNNGIPNVCPLTLDKHYDCDKFTDCEDCRCAHWLAESEEN